jgi:hypothetical protein
MNQYYLKITPEEKTNILDKHKELYNGYLTRYPKQPNEQPLYIQDYANDKNGITVSNTGVVKHYTNMNINESEEFEFDIDEIEDFSSEPIDDFEDDELFMEREFDFEEIEDEDLPKITDDINESLVMFKKIINYGNN